MILDVRTLAILSVAVYVLVAIAMALLAYGNRGNQGLRGVALGTVVIAGGLLLLGLRGPMVSLAVSIILGNGLTALGLALMIGGLRRYFGRPPGWASLFLPVLVEFAGMAYFSQVVDDISWRTVVTSTVHAWLGLLFAAQFLRAAPDEVWAGPRLMVGLAQICHVGVSLWRGIAAIAQGAPGDLFGPYWINAVAFLDAILTYMALAVGMILVEGQRLQSRLAVLAASDPLTGLANRRGFVDRVTADLPGQGAVLMLIDCDHFKSVNDSYGHIAGDAVLVEAARRLGVARRPQDSVARLGGEEFAWFMPETTVEAGFVHAETLRAGFAARPITVEGREIDLRVSIGVAAAPADGTTWPDLYRAADARLYRAKHQGRDRVVASPG